MRTFSRSRSVPIPRSSTAVGQQRLAAGAAEAGQQAHLGQRRAVQPGDGKPARPRERSDGGAVARWPQRRGAGLDSARPGRRLVTVHLGYGRSRTGRVGTGAGFDAYQIRASSGAWAASGVEVRKTGSMRPLAMHAAPADAGRAQHGARRARSTSSAATRSSRTSSARPRGDDTMYASPVVYDGYAWGMAIDLRRLHRLQRLRRSPARPRTTSRSSARIR